MIKTKLPECFIMKMYCNIDMITPTSFIILMIILLFKLFLPFPFRL